MIEFDELPPFVAPRLKIDRAELHMAEVEKERDLYFSRRPVRLVVEEWGVGSTVTWRLHVIETPPAVLSLAVGDAFHNLRTALDMAMCDAVRRTGRSTKGVHFPFCESEDALNGMLKHRHIERAGSDTIALIRRLKPYKDGNWGLRALHDFDIQDKHQMVIPAVTSAKLDLSYLMPEADADTRNKLSNWASVVKDGNMVVCMPAAHSPPLGSIIDAEYSLAVFARDRGRGHEMVDLISQLVSITKNIVDLLEGLPVYHRFM